MVALVACPHCNVHTKLTEASCGHCGERLRGADGKIPMTAAALLLGLTMGCGDGDTGSTASSGAPEYGAPATGGSAPMTTGGGGSGNEGGAGGADPAPEYGVAGSGQ